MIEYDAVIIGAGHNGLACAFYLARAGLRVRVVERLDVVGGAAVTEEFHPGFRNSVAAYTVGLLHPRIIADMRRNLDDGDPERRFSLRHLTPERVVFVALCATARIVDAPLRCRLRRQIDRATASRVV